MATREEYAEEFHLGLDAQGTGATIANAYNHRFRDPIIRKSAQGGVAGLASPFGMGALAVAAVIVIGSAIAAGWFQGTGVSINAGTVTNPMDAALRGAAHGFWSLFKAPGLFMMGLGGVIGAGYAQYKDKRAVEAELAMARSGLARQAELLPMPQLEPERANPQPKRRAAIQTGEALPMPKEDAPAQKTVPRKSERLPMPQADSEALPMPREDAPKKGEKKDRELHSIPMLAPKDAEPKKAEPQKSEELPMPKEDYVPRTGIERGKEVIQTAAGQPEQQTVPVCASKDMEDFWRQYVKLEAKMAAQSAKEIG